MSRYFTCKAWRENPNLAPIIQFTNNYEYGYFIYGDGRRSAFRSFNTLNEIIENLEKEGEDFKMEEITLAEVALII